MSYYIGPAGNGKYQADVTIDGKTQSEEFAQFHDAVAWVEKLQKEEERKRIETIRAQEDA